MSFSTVLTTLIGALGLANLVLLVSRAKPTSEQLIPVDSTPTPTPHTDAAGLTATPELTSVPQLTNVPQLTTDGQPPA